MKMHAGILFVCALLLASCATNPAKVTGSAATPPAAAAPAPVAAPAPAAVPAPVAAPPAAVVVEPAAAPVEGPAVSAVPARIDAWAGSPASAKELFGKVDALAKEGSWKAAWDLLIVADPEHLDPWILARSIDLILDGYIDTDRHVSFTLDDLPPNLTAAQARSVAQGQGDIDFSPAAIAEAQGKNGIASVPVLDKSIGRYYAEVSKLYAGKWFLPDDELVQRTLASFGKARLSGVYDLGSLQAEAEAMLNSGGAANAEALLVAAELLDPKATRIRYDHAVALLMLGRAAEALPFVDAALLDDTNPDSRISAYSIAAQAASMAGDADRAAAYLYTAEKEVPDRPEPGLFRHYLAVMKGDVESSTEAAKILIDRFGPVPQLIASLVGTWFQAGDAATAVAFIDAGLERYADQDEASGAFGFYKAVVLMQTAASLADLQAALPVLDAAEARFMKVYTPENAVFGIITNVRAEIAGQLAEASAAESAEGAAVGPQLPAAEAPTSPAP
ncbi:MAG: hypothetical protein WCL50_04015 [Spirochaetota bacterium]